MSAREVGSDARAGADVFHGAEICKQKVMQLMQEVGLPRALFPLENLEECGYVRDTGFFWLKWNQKFQRQCKASGRLVSYTKEITGLIEKCKVTKLSGVKIKQLLLWISITEIRIDDPSSAMVYFNTSLGVGDYLPFKAYELED